MKQSICIEDGHAGRKQKAGSDLTLGDKLKGVHGAELRVIRWEICLIVEY